MPTHFPSSIASQVLRLVSLLGISIQTVILKLVIPLYYWIITETGPANTFQLNFLLQREPDTEMRYSEMLRFACRPNPSCSLSFNSFCPCLEVLVKNPGLHV